MMALECAAGEARWQLIDSSLVLAATEKQAA